MANKKSNTVKMGLIRGNHTSNETKPDMEKFESLVKKGNEKTVIKKTGMLISRLDYPEEIKYNNDVIVISPRAKIKIADTSLIQSKLPYGVVLKK